MTRLRVGVFLGAFVLAAVALADEPHPSVVTRVREAFPHSEHWFRIVATLRFDRDGDGRLAPVLSSLTHPRVRWADGAGFRVLARFAPSFDGPMRVESTGQTDAFVEVRPVGAMRAQAVVEDGLVTYANAYADTDVLYKATPTHIDEYLLLRSPRAPTRLRFRLERGPSAARVRQAGAGVEVVDARGAAWLRATPPVATDSSGRRVTGRLVVHDDELEMRIELRGLHFPVLVDPDWMATGDMSYGRFYHEATVLSDGRVVASGGCSASICSGDLTLPACRDVVTAIEVFDFHSRTFSRAADSAVPRFLHAAPRLPDGSVLLAGGCTSADCSTATDVLEVLDTAFGLRAVGHLAEPRGGMASATLRDGRVLLAGGCTTTACTARTELYDPTGDVITTVAPMHVARGRAAVVPLDDGRVLVAGGCTSIGCTTVLADAEVYDPATSSWTVVGAMSTPRAGHGAARLDDGRVLVVGGCSEQTCTPVLASSELYDPVTAAFSLGPPLTEPRVGTVALRLPDGRVLVSQGCSAHTTCDLTNEVFDPARASFVAIESALTGRGFHGLAYSPPAGEVIAIGGCQPGTCSWWNETYDVSSLVPLVDAGLADAGLDGGGGSADGGAPDLGLRHFDAGRPRPQADAGGGPAGGGGCGCHVVASGHGGLVALLLVALALRRRRAPTVTSR